MSTRLRQKAKGDRLPDTVGVKARRSLQEEKQSPPASEGGRYNGKATRTKRERRLEGGATTAEAKATASEGGHYNGKR